MAIRFTHAYDLVYKIGAMVGGFVLVTLGAEALSPLSNFVEVGLKSKGLEWVWIVLMWTYFIGGYFGSIVLLGKTILPVWLPTYFYVRSFLFTKISTDEAERLDFLFDGSLGGIWYPLGAIRKIDPDFRREALFRFANKIAKQNGWRHPFAMPEDTVRNEYRKNQEKTTSSQQSAGHTSNAEASMPPDHQATICLQILGLSEMPRSFEQIKVAYRRKIKEFHPDKFSGERPEVLQYAEEMSKRLNVAYAYLEQRFVEKTA